MEGRRLSQGRAWSPPGGAGNGEVFPSPRVIVVLAIVTSLLAGGAAGALRARHARPPLGSERLVSDHTDDAPQRKTGVRPNVRHRGRHTRPHYGVDPSLPDPRWGRRVEPPNILIFVTDDQPAQEATYEVMPETMRLFREEGTFFPNAVVTTPLCCPSRASIFSGKYAHNHGVTDNRSTSALDTTETMQAVLRRNGYQTGFVGKYLNHLESAPHFDLWARFVRLGYYGAAFDVNGRVEEVADYSTTFIRRKALHFLDRFEQRDDEPWFMQVAPWTAHTPATPEAKYAAAPIPPWTRTPSQAEEDATDKEGVLDPFTMRNLERASEYRANQLRSLMSVDDLVRRVFARLERTGEDDNTLALFLSDNGQFWFEHSLRPIKRLPYNESVRVPFFVRWPKRGDLFPGGAVDDRIVANIDIAPTVYAATGTDPRYVVDGRNITTSERTHMFLEFLAHPAAEISSWKSLWTPTWSYVHHYDEEHRRQFFAENDPWQLDNVYGDHLIGNELVNQSELDSWIRRFSRCTGATCP